MAVRTGETVTVRDVRAPYAPTHHRYVMYLRRYAAPVVLLLVIIMAISASPALAVPVDPSDPASPSAPLIDISVGGNSTTPSTSLVILIAMTVLSVAPSLLLMMTSFT